MDYYSILGVDKKASLSEIRNAYKKKALFYHPDKNLNHHNQKEYEIKFKEISEAYQILSDFDSRSSYDKDNLFRKKFQSPFDIFYEIFEDIPSEYLKDTNKLLDFLLKKDMKVLIKWNEMMAKKYKFYSESSIYKTTKSIYSKPPTIETTICVSLEEVYNNEIKKIDIKRIRKNNVLEKSTFLIPLYETSILYEKEGDELEYYENIGDIQIHIDILDHNHFKKKGYDLSYVKDICLYEYLYGCSFSLILLDGSFLQIHNDIPIYKMDYKKINQYGLPKDNEKRGDLYIYYRLIINDIYLDDEHLKTMMYEKKI